MKKKNEIFKTIPIRDSSFSFSCRVVHNSRECDFFCARSVAYEINKFVAKAHKNEALLNEERKGCVVQ
jgi:hypothetical protein